ncbi:MAG: radical SAM protein [Clostridia bacterium]|nr:radical SAM protein [Clostridia bacterium]
MLIGRIAPHLWEEPPISGTRGTGAVFFSGCTLKCVYCQNASISHTPQGRIYTPEMLAKSMRRLEDMGMQSISLITATPYVPQILEALRIYRPRVPLVWNTSGYERVETLKLLEGVIDVYLPDLKHFSPSMSRLCAGVDDYFAVASGAIREMVRQCGVPSYDGDGIMTRGVLIRHLILPGSTGESIRLLQWVRDELPEGIPVSLMQQYVPCNDLKVEGLRRRILPKEYRRVRDAMIALDLPGFYQGPTSATKDFVPAFNQDESFV